MFRIEETLVKPRSRFFNIALNKGWTESQSRTISLKGEDPALFRVYIEAISHPEVDLLEIAKDRRRNLVRDLEDTHLHDFWCPHWLKPQCRVAYAFLKLYFLGEFLMDVQFKNMAVAAMVRGYNKGSVTFGTVHIQMIFEDTKENCGLEKFAADWMMVGCGLKRDSDAAIERLGVDFPPRAWKALARSAVAQSFKCEYDRAVFRPTLKEKYYMDN